MYLGVALCQGLKNSDSMVVCIPVISAVGETETGVLEKIQGQPGLEYKIEIENTSLTKAK